MKYVVKGTTMEIKLPRSIGYKGYSVECTYKPADEEDKYWLSTVKKLILSLSQEQKKILEATFALLLSMLADPDFLQNIFRDSNIHMNALQKAMRS